MFVGQLILAFVGGQSFIILAHMWQKCLCRGVSPLVGLNIQIIYVKYRGSLIKETYAYLGYLICERQPGLPLWRSLNTTVGKGIWTFIIL